MWQSAASVVSLDPKAAKTSKFLPLEIFDDEERFETRSPEEWIALGQNKGLPGTPCVSRFHLVNGDIVWSPAYAVSYHPDEMTYKIVWQESGKTKFVKRYNA